MKKIFARLFKMLLWLLAIQIVYTIVVAFINPPITLTMAGSLLRGEGLKRDYIDIEDMGSAAPLAVIASEDQQFAHHFGFDFKSIEKAIEFNEANEGRIRGGSTISQQVAKNVFLWQGRSYLRKGLEAWCTLCIELLYSKKRILELYLNIAEMGPGIYGIEAAARHYYKKPAAKLSRAEAASIAACLPAPKRYKANPPGRYISRRTGWIQRQMRQLEGDPDIKALTGL